VAAARARFELRWLGAQLRSLLGPLRGQRLCVAYSGGLDSTVLLTALARLRARARFSLRAVHVHHHLQPAADDWARHAHATARALRVPLEVLHARVPMRGVSIEAAARAARQQLFIRVLEAGEVLLTAHHQDDQLETVLLALMRGSGLRGLAAMPAVAALGRGRLVRPLLPLPRALLAVWAQRQALCWCEDDSNAQRRFDRNYLRHEVLPALRARWPGAAAAASRSAALLGLALAEIERVARARWDAAADGSALRATVLRRLPSAQRVEVLRIWLLARGLPLPDRRRLAELVGPLLAARADAVPEVRWPGARVRRHADRLFAAAEPAGARDRADAIEARAPPRRWDWRRRATLRLPDGGALTLVRDAHGDIDAAALPRPLTVEFRRGGERLPAAIGRVALKDLLQRAGVPPWRRAAVPLLTFADQIVAVGDLWVAPAFAAHASAAQRVRLRWRPSDD
jgi:tRNA(Ile)-lysidine synthase